MEAIFNLFLTTIIAEKLPCSLPYGEDVLISALKMHDGAAYRLLYLHYRGALYSIILQLIADRETANDVLQEVFTTVWQQIHRYDSSKGRLFTWLAKLTRNTAINKLRSKNYKSVLKTESIENFVSSVDQTYSQQHSINHIGLRQQVEQLKEDYKKVIVLSYYNGFTQEEIAKALNIPLGTVKTRLRSALLELRKQFT